MQSETLPTNPAEFDFLRLLLEEHWSEFAPSGPVAWVPPDDDDDGADGEGSGDADDDGDDSGDGDGDADGDGDDGDGDDADAGDSDAARAAEAEKRALKRRLDESEKKRKKAEKDLAKRTKEEREQAGEYKEMYEDSQKEVARLNDVIRSGAFERTVEQVARRLRYRNPALAASLVGGDLKENAVDDDGDVDERLVERELTKLAKRETYLVSPEQKPQGKVRGDDTTRRSGNGDEEYAFDPRGKMTRGRRNVPVGANQRGGE